jgi:hypothetical protein
MSRRPARITQTEIARAIRAARKEGASVVEVKIGDEATVRISLVPDKPIAEPEDIVL